MTTAVVYIQRCMIILTIFLCYFYCAVSAENSDQSNVNCVKYPYHTLCRGSMARKRAMLQSLYGLNCDDIGNENCIREFEERHRIPYIPLSKSKLLMSLLDNDLQKDAIYPVHYKQRNIEMNEGRSPFMENFLSELESSGTNY